MLLTEEQSRLLDESVARLDLGLRTTNCLEDAGILTVRDLLNSTPRRLLSINNFGAKMLDSTYAALAQHGFCRESQST